MNENTRYETEMEMIARIKREYEEATPWRNFAIAMALSSIFIVAIMTTAIIR